MFDRYVTMLGDILPKFRKISLDTATSMMQLRIQIIDIPNTGTRNSVSRVTSMYIYSGLSATLNVAVLHDQTTLYYHYIALIPNRSSLHRCRESYYVFLHTVITSHK